MKVKDIVLLAAEMLGLAETVNGYLENGEENGARETGLLVRAYNTVENELALDYLPLYCEDTVMTDTGRISYGALSSTPVRLVRLADKDGNALAFKIFPEFVTVDALGEVKVTYTYAKKKTIESDSEYKAQASEQLIAYGMAAEYCLWKGLFAEAGEWEKKYKSALTAAYKAKPSKVMRTRRWA